MLAEILDRLPARRAPRGPNAPMAPIDLTDFLTAHVIPAQPTNWVTVTRVYDTYKSWALTNGHEVAGINRFSQAMTSAGFPVRRGPNGVRRRTGMKLR